MECKGIGTNVHEEKSYSIVTDKTLVDKTVL